MHGKMLQCASSNEIIQILYMFINVTQLVENSKVHMNGIEDPCQSIGDAHWPLGVYFCFRTTRKSWFF